MKLSMQELQQTGYGQYNPMMSSGVPPGGDYSHMSQYGAPPNSMNPG